MVRLHGGVRLEPAVQSSLKCNKQEHLDRSRDRNWKKKTKRKRVIITRITALVAAPTGVAERCGKGTWRDIVGRFGWSLEREKRGGGVSLIEGGIWDYMSFSFRTAREAQKRAAALDKWGERSITKSLVHNAERENLWAGELAGGKAVERLLHD